MHATPNPSYLTRFNWRLRYATLSQFFSDIKNNITVPYEILSFHFENSHEKVLPKNHASTKWFPLNDLIRRTTKLISWSINKTN